MQVPQKVTFESMAKAFMSLAGERYPNAEKVKQAAAKLCSELTGRDMVVAQIIIINQFRDAVREVAANKIYRSPAHRDELLMAIVEASEDLEEELEQIDEEALREVDESQI